jgi:hypothetical protein
MPQPWSPYTIPSISLKASPSNTAIPLTLADLFLVKICTVDLFNSGHTGLNGDIKPDPKASVNS